MDRLPYELIVQICIFLDPLSATRLQQTAHRYLSICRDPELWRQLCFDTSSYLDSLHRRREFARGSRDTSNSSPRDRQLAGLARVLSSSNNGRNTANSPAAALPLRASEERIRIMANWDPSYKTEKVDWYTEYIHRNAPIEVSWLQQPRNRESPEHEALEVRGVGVYNPPGRKERGFAVGPLDDGSVAIWDLTGSMGRKGGILGRSDAGVLLADGMKSGTKLANTGVVECVTVDNERGRAYIAVQSDLVEIDLETLQAVGHERYPFSISALSKASITQPMTIATNLSLHLFDPRAPQKYRGSISETIESDSPLKIRRPSFIVRDINSPPLTNYAPLFRPGPLSVLHMETSLNAWDGNGEVYVCGRFPSILNYDRRMGLKLRGTIHSGGRLCSMVSMPFAFSGYDKECMRRGELSIDQATDSKTKPGNTIVACGEYNSKGSLELYGLSPFPELTTLSSDSAAGKPHDAVFKNRQTSSSSKLLSVENHNTRLVCSDGGGNLKWMERDGFTEVRQWNIAHRSTEGPKGIFGTLGDNYMDGQSGDIVRKILHTTSSKFDKAVNYDDLLLWTGEKLGILAFSSKAGFTADSFEEKSKSLEEIRTEREERIYAQTMRRALERQADEVRFVRNLGMGLGLNGDV